jgi:mRNA interferase MazF
VVPITSNVARIYPSEAGEAAVELLGESRKAMADRIATVSKLRLKSKLGNISSADMLGTERALGIQLGLRIRIR